MTIHEMNRLDWCDPQPLRMEGANTTRLNGGFPPIRDVRGNRGRAISDRQESTHCCRSGRASILYSIAAIVWRAERLGFVVMKKMMAGIVAKRLVEHLERLGLVVMKKPPIGGAVSIGRGREGN